MSSIIIMPYLPFLCFLYFVANAGGILTLGLVAYNGGTQTPGLTLVLPTVL
jgi:hypothetical protein